MSIESTVNPINVTDRPTRLLGKVGIIGNYQEDYLPRITQQLELNTVLLAELAGQNINIVMEVDVDSVLEASGDNLLEEDLF